MSQYLFLFTIGPVQSFIAQARKTQDLYAGSSLLSYLINSAMKELKNKVNNCEFIFPHKEIKHKPNRFIAEIEFDDVERVGKDLKYFVETELVGIANSALDSLGFAYSNGFKESFLAQIKNHLQIYWVACPLKGDNYSQVYKELESYLGAIKNVREFNQLKETGRKCSLCGERNALFYKKTLQNKKPAYIQESAIELDKNELNSGEGLCAVCFIKRFYKKDNCFPSTAEIAAMDWLSKIDEITKNDYRDLFNNFDEQLFYEENLREEYLKKYGHFKDEKSLSDAKVRLNEFYKINDKYDNEIGKPPKYYALLMLDGDDMAKWLSGEYLEDKTKLKDFHIESSKALGSYAKDVESIIPKPKGTLVYAGGDDVLAFINLNHLLPVINELRKEFPKFEEFGFEITDNKKSSASAGITIAHYKTPLSEVLKWAKKMEHEAKEDGGRDAFAIAVLKHSGEINKTVWKWDVDAENKSLKIKLFEDLIKELNNEEGFSNTFIKNLNIEFQKLGEIDSDVMFKTELKRLLKRSSQLKGDKEKKKQKVQEWQEKLFNLYIDSQTKDNFLSFLNIADFLAREAE